jgi:nucleoside 2-deoxyribosyltransferase
MLNDVPSIYCASPLGFSEAGRFFLYGELIPRIEAEGFHVIDPWVLTPQQEIETSLALPPGERRRQVLAALNLRIGRTNEDGIRRSHALFALLDGSDVDSGTSSEIGFAASLDKPILGYRNDFRQAGDNDASLVNIQVEYFIYSRGGRIITTLEEMAPALHELKETLVETIES